MTHTHETHVQCQRCHKQMIPTVTCTRGLYVGWQWGGRFGAGHVNGSVCPFCLSPHWDDAKAVDRGNLFRVFALIVTLMVVALYVTLVAVIDIAIGAYFDIKLLAGFGAVAMLISVIAVGYFFFQWFVTTRRLPF